MADKTIHDFTNKATPVDTDELAGVQSPYGSGDDRKFTWANVKATLKTYFDGLYAAALGADDNYVTDAEKTVIGNTSGTNSGDQSAGDFNHDDLANITGTAGQYNHPTDAQMTVLGNTSGTNSGDQTRGDLGLDTDDSPQFAGIELGHADDTTITRTGAGAIAVEGTAVLLSGGALGTPASGTLTNCSGLPASGLASGTLAEDVLIKLDPALSADGKYCGYGEDVTAGTNLAFGEVAYYAAADSKWEKTDADASATAGPVKIGIVVVAGNEDATVSVMYKGKIREDDWNWGTIGAPVYLDTATAGGMTQTAPSGSGDIVRIVGYAIDANTIWFEPDTSYAEVV